MKLKTLKDIVKALSTVPTNAAPFTFCALLDGRTIRRSSITLEAKLFFDIPCDAPISIDFAPFAKHVRSLKGPKNEVELSIHEGKLKVICGPIVATFDERDSLCSAKDWPSPMAEQDTHGLTLPVEKLAWVAMAMSKNDSRKHLCCTLLDTKDNELVATDGHRLHKAGLGAAHCLPHDMPSLVVSAVAVKAILKTAGKVAAVDCLAGEDYLTILLEHGFLVAPIQNDASFPPYRQVIQREGSLVSASLACDNVFSLITGAKAAGNVTRLSINGSIVAESQTASVKVPYFNVEFNGKVTENADMTGDEPEVSLHVNGSYLADGLIDGMTNTIHLNDKLNPIHVEAGLCLAVIMPTRE